MNKDTIIGIVGCAVLVAAMVGVFAYERANATATTTEPGASQSAAGPTVSGTATLGKADTHIANFTATSAKNVTFHLTWKATNGKDTLKLTVAPPTGSGIMEGAASDAKDTGDITVTVHVPDGASPEGGWKVTVDFTTATPGAMPGGISPPTPPPNSTDGTVSYSVTTTLT